MGGGDAGGRRRSREFGEFAHLAADAGATDANTLSEVVVTRSARRIPRRMWGLLCRSFPGRVWRKAITNVAGLQNAIPQSASRTSVRRRQPQLRIRASFLDYTSNNASPIGVSLDDVAFASPSRRRASCST